MDLYAVGRRYASTLIIHSAEVLAVCTSQDEEAECNIQPSVQYLCHS